MINNLTEIAVPGFLKRGFPKDLSTLGATIVGSGRIHGANLYRLQDSSVALRVSANSENSVYVDVFNVPQMGLWKWLDDYHENSKKSERLETSVRMFSGEFRRVWAYFHTEYLHHLYGLRFPKVEAGRFELGL